MQHRNAHLVLLVPLALSGLAACDSLLAGLEPLTAITQAVTADDAANSDAVDDSSDEADAAYDDSAAAAEEEGRGDCHGGRMPRAGDGDAVAVAACLAPVAEGVDVGRAHRGRGHLAAIYDEDESGDLSDTELAAFKDDAAAGCAARNARLLGEFDADADGVLSQEEFDAARDAGKAARDAERAALDTDGDGDISREEHDAAAAALVAAWDTDGDGTLAAEERAAMREALQALVRAGERLPPLPFHRDGRSHRGPPDGRDGEGEGEAADDGSAGG